MLVDLFIFETNQMFHTATQPSFWLKGWQGYLLAKKECPLCKKYIGLNGMVHGILVSSAILFIVKMFWLINLTVTFP